MPLVRIDALHADGERLEALGNAVHEALGEKRALYRRIAELAQKYAGTEPRNVFITVTENESIDWSFGHGEAQYAPVDDHS